MIFNLNQFDDSRVSYVDICHVYDGTEFLDALGQSSFREARIRGQHLVDSKQILSMSLPIE